MASEVLTIPAEATPVLVSAPAPRVERLRSPGQMGYADLRKGIKELEAQNADLTGRNEVLESRRAEDREQIEELLARLASYDHAEAQLRQAAEAYLTQSLALFNARAVSVRQKFRDFDTVLAVLESKPDLLRLDLRRAIVEMENGPFVLYLLIKTPDLCRQLQHLPLGEAIAKAVLFGIQAEQKLIQESVTANYLAVTGRK